RVRQRQLLVGLLVHEHDLVARVVEVLHVLGLGADALELLARPERLVDDRAGLVVLQLGADERAPLTGLHVLELDDTPRLPIELGVPPVFELVGGADLGHRRGSVPPPAQSTTRRAVRSRPRERTNISEAATLRANIAVTWERVLLVSVGVAGIVL